MTNELKIVMAEVVYEVCVIGSGAAGAVVTKELWVFEGVQGMHAC
jgi:hypothetical protein